MVVILYSVIDIGSNSVRLCIYKINSNPASFEIILNQKEMLGLVGLIVNKKLTELGQDKIINTLRNFSNILNELKISSVSVIATASFRAIADKEFVVNNIKKATGLNINIISGEEEAECDFLGVTYNSEISNGVIVDIGGGSTELIPVLNKSSKSYYTIPIGSLNLHSLFVEGIIPTNKERKFIVDFVEDKISEAKPEKIEVDTIFGVGGTIHALKKLVTYMYPEMLIGNNVKAEVVQTILKVIKKGIAKEDSSFFKELFKIIPDRILTITPGLIILQGIIDYYNIKTIHVSDYGVREGHLIKHVLKQ